MIKPTFSRRLILGGILLSFLLSGCASLWESDTDKKMRPAELEELSSSLPIRLLWSKSIGTVMQREQLKLVPAFSGGVLFTADRNGLVQAHDGITGKTLWKRHTNTPLSSGPGVGNGLVLVGTLEADLIALDELTGLEKWRVKLSSELLSVAKADRGIAVAYTVDGRLHGRSTIDGRPVWTHDRPTPALTLHGSSSPVVYEGQVICGFADGKLVALNIITGEPLWESSITLPTGRTDIERMVDIDGDPVIRDGVVFVATYQGELAAISAASGSVFWRKELSSHKGIAVNSSKVFTSDDADQVWAVNARSGSSIWKNRSLSNRRLTAPAIFGDYLLIGDLEGYVHWISQADGKVVARSRVGSDPISITPLVFGKVAFILGNEGDLSAFTLKPKSDKE